MSTTFRPVIGVVTSLPEKQIAPATDCDQCAYYQPSFERAAQGKCVHIWSDYVDDLVFSTSVCPHVTHQYDPTLDCTQELLVPVRR